MPLTEGPAAQCRVCEHALTRFGRRPPPARHRSPNGEVLDVDGYRAVQPEGALQTSLAADTVEGIGGRLVFVLTGRLETRRELGGEAGEEATVGAQYQGVARRVEVADELAVAPSFVGLPGGTMQPVSTLDIGPMSRVRQ